MRPLVSGVSLSSDGKNIIFYEVQSNHNSVQQNLANKIADSLLGNLIHMDLGGKVYTEDMGHGMACLFTHSAKVSVYIVFIFLHFLKILNFSFCIF